MAEAADRRLGWVVARAELDGVFERFDATQIDGLGDFLSRIGGRLFFTGQGRSGLAARMAAMRFVHLGRPAHVVGEATTPSIGAGDALVVVSGRGRTPVSVAFARTADQQGASVVLITHEAGGPIHDIADLVVKIDVAASRQFGGTLFEQAALIVLDSAVFDLASAVEGAYTTMARNHANLE
ncbi:MAG: SIS domain-containing protein [Actinomycetota bacterium]|nr:SIS domain-containing protein [Actinomycetota bacterium]